MLITLEKNSRTPLIRQVYGQIREQVLAGRLPTGSRLPSSRDLAAQLAVSRNVVLEAYDLLYAEGFTESRQGSGTYIAAGAACPPVPAHPAADVPVVSMGYESPREAINFKPGTPDLSCFPTRLWQGMLKEAYAFPPEDLLGYGTPEGRRELRQAIRDYVVNHRGVACDPEQIVITAGTTQAIGIVARLLLQERRDVVLEDPITRDIQLILRQEGAVLHPTPVDDAGLDTELLPEAIRPAFVYVTPSHQFPWGGTMPIQRRIALLRYAERHGAWLVEDDYDSEFRFAGPPLSSLHSLAPGRVIYIGTFSKTLCPSLRTGYLVLPPALVGSGRRSKWQCDLHNETPTQLALAAFIRQGHYLRHLGRMKRHYAGKRRLTETALRSSFGTEVQILGSATGLHLTARFSGTSFTPALLARIEKAGVRAYPAEAHAMVHGRLTDALILGYGNLEEDEIRTGITILRSVIMEGMS